MKELIYFPYINVPPTDWTLRTLIYYDNLSSIVPQQFFYDPERHYDKHMLELVKSELVIPIDPYRSLKRPGDLVKNFVKYITQSEAELNNRRKDFQANKTLKIHFDKFDDILYHQLMLIGIAKIDSKNFSWCIVELKTAKELMTFLATILSEKLNLGLTTDAIDYVDLLNLNSDISIIDTNIEHKREMILQELIPLPRELNLSKLRKFKDKHYDLLASFRNRVEQIVLDDTLILESELIKEKVKELKIRKEELSAKMNESQFKNIIFGSVCGVIGAFQGLRTADTTGAVIGAIPGFLEAIHSALKIESPEKIFDQSGMKYLALIDKKLNKTFS